MTGKERRFCEAYLVMRDAKEAAVAAGYLPLFARSTGLKLLAKEEVRQWLRRAEQQKRCEAYDQAVLSGLERLAFGNANDSAQLLFYSEEELREQLPMLDLFRVSELRKTRSDAIEVKFYDRFRAMELLLQVADRGEHHASIYQLMQALGQASSTEGGTEDE